MNNGVVDVEQKWCWGRFSPDSHVWSRSHADLGSDVRSQFDEVQRLRNDRTGLDAEGVFECEAWRFSVCQAPLQLVEIREICARDGQGGGEQDGARAGFNCDLL